RGVILDGGRRPIARPFPEKSGPFAGRATDRASRVQSRSNRVSGDAVSTVGCRPDRRLPPASPRRNGGDGLAKGASKQTPNARGSARRGSECERAARSSCQASLQPRNEMIERRGFEIRRRCARGTREPHAIVPIAAQADGGGADEIVAGTGDEGRIAR